MTITTYQPRRLVRRPRPASHSVFSTAAHVAGGMLLGPPFAAAALAVGTPGMRFHLEAARVAFSLLRKRGAGAAETIGRLLLLPLDSTRYFEFDWVWRRLVRRPDGQRFLDVSSPRLLPLAYARRPGVETCWLLNPDSSDLSVTREWAEGMHLGRKCRFVEEPIERADFDEQTFDVVTSISVLEHIVDESVALKAMWQQTAPGGVLLLTLPCAAKAYDQSRDFNEYNLVEPSLDGTYFFQRFYDERSLESRIFSVVGRPSASAVYGEVEPGYFGRNAEQKMRGLPYPIWRESYMMGKDFRAFPSIDSLPGEGVVGLEFIKS